VCTLPSLSLGHCLNRYALEGSVDGLKFLETVFAPFSCFWRCTWCALWKLVGLACRYCIEGVIFALAAMESASERMSLIYAYFVGLLCCSTRFCYFERFEMVWFIMGFVALMGEANISSASSCL